MRAKGATVGLLLLSIGCTGSEDAPASSPNAPPPTDITTLEIEVGDFVFDARAAGPAAGEVVFLLHGFPETSYEWRHQLPVLAAAGYRAIAPDQRGYSPRARPPAVEDYDVELLARDVVDMADALGVQRFHLVGHDWGASVAWIVALRFPERLITLNPISVGHPDAVGPLRADPASCQYAASAYIDSFVSPGYADVLVANDSAILRAFYASLPQDASDTYVAALGNREAMTAALNWYRARLPQGRATPLELVGSVSVPTLFTWSDGDAALCRDGAELTSNFVTAPYRFEVLTGVDHWVPEKAAERYEALLLPHLSAHATRR